MFIKQIQTNFTYFDKFGLKKQGIRTTLYGKLSNKDSITVDSYIRDGRIVEKRYVIFNKYMQKIINKVRRRNGKGFERIG